MPDSGPEFSADEVTKLFLAALTALLGRPPGLEDRFGVAVSGGPDSMALLDLMVTVAPGQVEAATVDHGLRTEAAIEAEMVAGWCADRSVPHVILRPDLPIRGSLQAEARVARYALLDRWMVDRSLDWLLTAHHADDQLETILMRLNRASGVSGLAGIRGRRGHLLRPLLGIRRATLASYVQERSIPHVIDPSNADLRFDRVRMRTELMDTDWLDPIAVTRSAAALAEAEEAIEWSVARLYDEYVEVRGDALCLTVTAFPHEYLHRLLRRMLMASVPDMPEPRGEQIAQAIIQLSRGKKLSIGACIATGGAVWAIKRAPPRRGA